MQITQVYKKARIPAREAGGGKENSGLGKKNKEIQVREVFIKKKMKVLKTSKGWEG